MVKFYQRSELTFSSVHTTNRPWLRWKSTHLWLYLIKTTKITRIVQNKLKYFFIRIINSFGFRRRCHKFVSQSWLKIIYMLEWNKRKFNLQKSYWKTSNKFNWELFFLTPTLFGNSPVFYCFWDWNLWSRMKNLLNPVKKNRYWWYLS